MNALASRQREDKLFQLRLASRVAAAIFEVNRDKKKRSRPITEEDFLPNEVEQARPELTDEELVAKIAGAFGGLPPGKLLASRAGD